MVTGYELRFGVPLEDVFPECDIHPTLKSLLNLAIKSIISSSHSIKQIIKFLQGPLKTRLHLKEEVQSAAKNINITEVLPGAFLWVLRHFLGLLPLPILPSYTNEQYFSWNKLAELCNTELSNSFRSKMNMEEICYQISGNLNKLPEINFILIYNVLNFLRCLSVWPRREPHICKSSVKALVKYFSSAIFLRPYRPGYVTNIDKKYYPLMAVLIIHWPNIKELCFQTKHNRIGSLIICNPLYHKTMTNYKWKTDKTVQTNIMTDTDQQALSFQDLSLCKSCGCQTNFEEYTYNKSKDTIDNKCTCEHYYSEPIRYSPEPLCKKHNYFEYVIKFNPSPHFSTSYLNEDPLIRKVFSESQISNISDSSFINDTIISYDVTENIVSEQNLNTQNKTQNSNTSISLSPKVTSYEGEYIDDDYAECYYEEPKKEANVGTSKEPITSADVGTGSENILEKISKIGWTYTAKDETAIEDTKPENEDFLPYDSPPIGWKIPKENYNIYFDDKLSNKVDKIDVEEISLKEPNEDTNNEENLVSDIQNSPVNTSRSRRSLMSLHGVKSRLGFFKMFSPKLIKLKKTTSEEHVSSKIKYEKMDSARSTMF